MAASKNDLRVIVEQFEKCAARQQAASDSANQVKLRASERDLLGVTERIRDETVKALRGDKAALNENYGGDCEMIGRMFIVLDSVVLSEMHQGDDRMTGCRKQLDTVKLLLEELGSFKPWTIVPSPQILKYPELVPRFSPGDRITLNPVISGAKATDFYVEGAPLPASLRLNKESGVISGQLKPGAIIPMTTYVIVAANNKGSCNSDLAFSVAEPPPESILYDHLPSIFCLGEQVAFLPTVDGGFPTGWTVTPEFPDGLKLDALKGFISGNPRQSAPETVYTVAASNSGGQTQVDLAFSVKPPAPAGLSYPTAEHEYPCGLVVYLLPDVRMASRQAAQSNASVEILEEVGAEAPQTQFDFQPASRGEQRRSFATSANALKMTRASIMDPHGASRAMQMGLLFSVSPPLPDGLEISEGMGVISGKPTKETDKQTYTITAKNESGDISCDLELTIKIGPPESLEYEVEDAYHTGEEISLYPDVEGVVAEWIFEGDLPEGLHFNASFGSIEGTPTKPCSVTLKVIAKNEVGAAESEIELVIKIAPPEVLEYDDCKDAYPLLRRCEINPTVEGEVEEFTVTPSLPAGLELDAKTGVIFGTPTAKAEEAAYEIIARNSSGSISATVKFRTEIMAPTALAYPSVDDLYYYGEEVNLEPSVEGGVTQWIIEPILPEGMKMDDATGKISGRPSTTREETTYTVTASNEAGGTSLVLVFMVTAPAPVDLQYPSLLEEYFLGQDVNVEASLQDGACGTFVIEPALPSGLTLNAKTGCIRGKPFQETDEVTYTVTVTNIAGKASCKVKFEVQEQKKSALERLADGAFAKRLEAMTDIKLVRKMNPDKQLATENWMLWMVHRAFLNDPELTIFQMDSLHLPLPQDEPRLAPKLMQAIAHNTHIKELLINNVNLQTPQAFQLVEALRSNSTLQVLGISSNQISSTCIHEMANAIKENADCSIEQWRFAGLLGMDCLGRPAEQGIAEMVEANKKILKLGVELKDPHWRQRVDSFLTRNNDLARRARKARAGKVSVVEKIAPKEKQLGCVLLDDAPEKAVYDVFADDNEQYNLLRRACASAKKMPTKEQLQAAAKKDGIALKFSEVAPLITEFRAKLLDVFVEKKITVLDPFKTGCTGTLSAYSVKNDKWLMDIWPDESSRYFYRADSKPPTLEVSDVVARWLEGGA